MSVSTIYGPGAAVAAPAVQEQQKPAPQPVTAAVDIASARVAARLSGMRVEALSERTETSTTWVNKDGSLTTELSAGPVRFMDATTGEWRDVDVDLAVQADGSVAAKAHPQGLTLAGKTGAPARSLRAAQSAPATDLVTLGQGAERITLQWRGGLPAPKVDGTRATYVNAVPGADVIVESTRTGFEQFVEIKEKPTEGYSYTLPLKAKGLKVAQQADGSVLFTDKKSKKTAVMPAPVMWDATIDPVSGKHTRQVNVGMKVVKTKDGVDLVLTPDAKFLADPATKYPVTVDPSTSSLSNVFDTYVQQGTTVDWSTDVELDLGNPGTKNADGTYRIARSFISWNTAPIADALVTDAKLSLWNFHSGNYTGTSCPNQPWEVWSTGAATTSSRWTAQPSWIASKATSSETRGNASCSTQPDGWINANVTTMVQEWASAKAAKSHMGLRASDENVTGQWKRVNSANAASNPPKLVVTYNYRPRTGTKQEAGPPFFSYGGSYMVNTVTPTLRDTFVDPNGDKVNGTFQIFDSATNTQVGNVIVSPWVTSGEAASVTVPAGLLTNGKTYKFRTSPYDGAHYNLGWSEWKTFTVDTSNPSAPTGITSTDYPAGQWVKGAGQAGTFTVTPNGTDHNWLEWSLDGVTWTKVVTGGSTAAKTISVTPPQDGTHTLQVRQVDKADSKSEAIEYTFHAGPGGFVQPAEGERTARRLPLIAEANGSTYNAVSFSWRRSEADPWAQIPLKDVFFQGSAITSWPRPLVNGKNELLVWNATDTVDPDGSIEIKADFTGPNGAAKSTQPQSVIVDRDASGAASEDVGPGSLNLLTGDYTLSATDASFFGMAVTRSASSRTPNGAASLEGQAAIFGKEWVAGTTAELTQTVFSHIRKVSDTALDVVLEDGTAIAFTSNAAKTGWIAEKGSEHLTLSGRFDGSFTLSDTGGTVTTFTKADPAAPTWQVSSTLLKGLTNTTTTVVSEAVTVDGKRLAKPKRIIAPTSAVTVATCEANPATRGCRVLEFVYATATTATGTQTDDQFGDFAGQVRELRLWASAPGAASGTAIAVASYRYDSNGSLRQVWDPRLSKAGEHQYAYWGGRVTWLQPAGQLPFTFTYGNAGAGPVPGDGMLLKVSRAALVPGSVDQQQGSASTSVVYGVPLTGGTAPYAMGATDVKAWGQSDLPTDATAIFPSDSVPASHSGPQLTASAYQRATVHYLNASGRAVNAADPGGHISATEYDRFGNTVRELTPANRTLALGTTAAERATLRDLGIDGRSAAERARLLSSVSLYDPTGMRETETFGPLHRADLTQDLKDGTTVLVRANTPVAARAWTVKEYDEGRPTDGSAAVSNQVTLTISGVRVRDHDSVMGDKQLNETQYDWAKGLPTLKIQDPGGLNLVTSTTYDAEGRVTGTQPPGGTGQDAASRVIAYWSATGTGWCKGRPEWADQVCWTGPAGDIVGGGSNPVKVEDSTMEYGLYGQQSKSVDTANGVTRTISVAFDAAGRQTTTTMSGGLGQAVSASTITYDPAGGQPLTVTSPTGGTITRQYDKLGRLISYTDADGGTTTTRYDALDRPLTITDSSPSTRTFTYDTAIEPRGMATKLVDSVAGTFTATYNAAGSIVAEQLPGGYTLRQRENTLGITADRVYTRDADGTVVYSDAVTRAVDGKVTTRTSGAASRDYTYDGAGRLTVAEETADSVCTRRAYAFDKRSNRTSLTTTAAQPGLACTTTGGTTRTHTYDSADRLVDPGYAYDAYGRTTAMPGATIDYYANNLVRRQTAGTKRQTWELDAALRFRSWTTETNSGGTWSQTGAKVNHYANDTDSPSWIVEDGTGAVSRNVASLSGGLAAVTGKTGGTVLMLTNIHGDIGVQLPLDASQSPVALESDEYGNVRTGSPAARYGWLGAFQRSSETPTDALLMGARLYSPGTGRFLSVDPLYGGSCNSYDYVCADPVNTYDNAGTASCKTVSRTYKLYEGAVRIQLGTISMQAEFCLNSKGNISSSWAWTSDDESGVASVLGWKIQFHGPARNARSSTYHEWGASGMAQVCAFKIFFACGYQERFAVTVAYSRNVQGPGLSGHRRYSTKWRAYCTNRHCKLRFS
ncbi:RHS repeat-associated core domain-containing protein [Streptomyces sp. NPDC085529]|uniref:RHS repeat-associated core domain-containing protein n=1 Tax=Streptomyces sp. NPDC085529 TaxID=3365729 RepID=UPI0037D56B05